MWVVGRACMWGAGGMHVGGETCMHAVGMQPYGGGTCMHVGGGGHACRWRDVHACGRHAAMWVVGRACM